MLVNRFTNSEPGRRLEGGYAADTGTSPYDRLTAVLGMTMLGVAMVLLGSIATAFDTQLESDRWLGLGATSFFPVMGLSALFFITRLAGTSLLPISPRETCYPDCAGRSAC